MEKKRNSPAENLPPWRVTSEGDFWDVASRERPAILLPFGGEFQWFGSHWVVPGVYSTAKALVVDFCRQVDVDAMRAFQEKHRLTPDRDDIRNYTREEAARIEAESPMGFFFHVAAQVNGKELPMSRGSGVGYIPYQVEASAEALSVVLHYGLDPSTCWYILRCIFPWRRRQQVESLSFRLEVEPVRQPGQPFQIQPGEKVELTHPQTGERYTLTALDLVPDTVDSNFPDMEDWDVPNHLWKLVYTLEPELEELVLQDAEEGDPMRPKAPREDGAVGGTVGCAPLQPVKKKTSPGPASIGVIGGAAELVEIQAGHQVAFSSLRFEPAASVTWLPMFQGMAVEGITVDMLPQA